MPPDTFTHLLTQPRSTAQAVLAKILTSDTPAPTDVRLSTPPNVDAAIRKALEKLPADRFRSVQEFAKALSDPGFRHGEEVGVTAAGGAWNRLSITMTITAAAFGLVALLSVAWTLSQSPDTPRQPVGAYLELPQDAYPLPNSYLALADDGSTVVVTVRFEDEDMLMQRRLGELDFTLRSRVRSSPGLR